jgi:hypothetical protein
VCATMARTVAQGGQTYLVERTVEQDEHALVEDVGPAISGVALMLTKKIGMVVAIEKHVIFSNLASLQAGTLEHDNQLWFLGRLACARARRLTRGRAIGDGGVR